MSEPQGLFASDPATIYFDAVTAIQPDGRELIIEDFENRGWIDFMQRRGSGDEIEFEEDPDPISGEHVMAFYPGVGQSPGLRAAHVADPAFCSNTRCTVPTIVSQDFAERQRLEVGDRYALRTDTMILSARVASIVELFPTLRPDELSFIVADFDALFHLGSVTGPASVDLAVRSLARHQRRSRAARGGVGRVEPSALLAGSDQRPRTAAGRQRPRSADDGGRLVASCWSRSSRSRCCWRWPSWSRWRSRRVNAVWRWRCCAQSASATLSILIQLFLEYAIIVGTGLVLGRAAGQPHLAAVAGLPGDRRARPHGAAAVPGGNRLADSWASPSRC